MTSMDRDGIDGTYDGYSTPITRVILGVVDIPVIASGGASGPEHMYEAFVKGHAYVALATSIFIMVNILLKV